MGDEDKQFEASQQKLQKARKEGQVVKSKDFSIIHIGQTYDDGYHSRPSWDCTYQNEQNIRHMVKQFLKDME